jgi:hypothetical protein
MMNRVVRFLGVLAVAAMVAGCGAGRSSEAEQAGGGAAPAAPVVAEPAVVEATATLPLVNLPTVTPNAAAPAGAADTPSADTAPADTAPADAAPADAGLADAGLADAGPAEPVDWTMHAFREGDYYVLGNPDAPVRLIDYSDFL